jgi:hypothetical protein
MMKKFSTIKEMVGDVYFRSFLDLEISKIKNQRLKRPAPANGLKYKRDWFDRLTESGNFSTEFFIHNIESVWNKTSLLNSETRQILILVCDSAIRQTLDYYAKIKTIKEQAKTLEAV